jgi:DNA-binding protein HU-beta
VQQGKLMRYLRGWLMTRNHLIDQIAASTERSKREIEQVIDAALNAIAEALGKGEKVELRGFGSFQVNAKKERQGRNPRTGEAMTIAARKVAVFKPGRELAERITGASASSDETGLPATTEEIPVAEPGEGSAKVHGDKIDV